MQIVFAIISFQVFGHELETAKPHPLRAAKDGPPPFSVLLRGEDNQWYHRRVEIGNQKDFVRVGHPPIVEHWAMSGSNSSQGTRYKHREGVGVYDILTQFQVVRSNYRASVSKFSLSMRLISARLFAVLLLLTLATCVVLAAHANPKDKPKPWVTKDWTQWTSADCLQVLNSSPWSHQIATEALGRSGTMYTLMQLRSALPVRQALIRTLQNPETLR